MLETFRTHKLYTSLILFLVLMCFGFIAFYDNEIENSNSLFFELEVQKIIEFDIDTPDCSLSKKNNIIHHDLTEHGHFDCPVNYKDNEKVEQKMKSMDQSVSHGSEIKKLIHINELAIFKAHLINPLSVFSNPSV